VYVEPFAGGAAVLFTKPSPTIGDKNYYREVINDIDGDLINFYRQLRENGPELIEKLQLTLHSEEEYTIAKDFTDCDDLERARRYYVNISQSFANMLGVGWRRGVFGRNDAATWANKIAQLPEYLERLASIYISNTDSLKCIDQWDSPQTCFYCDPPYPNTNQGHYAGYTIEQYQSLIDKLDTIDGSFLLSNYECGARIPESWERFEFSSTMVASRKKTNLDKKRTEIVYRKITNETMRPELQKLFNAGKFDCFKGANYMAEITIKVPIDDPRALKAAAKMLMDLAGAPIKVVEAVEAVEAPPMPAPIKAEAPAPIKAVEAPAPIKAPPVEAVEALDVSQIEYVTRSKTDEIWPQEKGGVLVDRAGFPWDSRIHSTPPKCTKRAGHWRAKRGRDESIVPAVEAQLKTRFGVPDPPPPPPAPVEALPPPPAPVEALPPPPAPVEENMGFPDFMKWVSKQDPAFTSTPGLNKLCEHVGLPSIGLLAVHPTHIPALVRYVQAGGK